MNEKHMTTVEAARYLNLSPGTLKKWRCTGEQDIPFLKIGRRVIYKKADVDAWLVKHERNTL